MHYVNEGPHNDRVTNVCVHAFNVGIAVSIVFVYVCACLCVGGGCRLLVSVCRLESFFIVIWQDKELAAQAVNVLISRLEQSFGGENMFPFFPLS